MDDAGDRPPVDNQRGRHRPVRIADHESAGAVDRVDDDETAADEALEIVDGLLREPARLGQGLPQAALQSESAARSAFVTGEPPTFVSDLRRGARSQPEIFERQRPGLARGGGQESRAAGASMSASTLKGGMSVAVVKSAAWL